MTIFSAGETYASDYFSNAVRIYNDGRFFEASIEFERAIFYECDSISRAYYKYCKSLCYKGMARYDKALSELETINASQLHDSLWMMIRYEQALCNYMIDNVDLSIRILDDIKLRLNDTLLINNKQLIPLNIICLNTRREWRKAQELWLTYIGDINLPDSVKRILETDTEKLYFKDNIPGYYSPEKASRYSCFIPGSGQIYCGAVGEGLFNFLINASLLGFTVWEFYSQYYLTGYFIGAKIFNKFYFGGIRRANNLALERNKQAMADFNAETTSLLLRTFNPGPAEIPIP